MPPNQTDQRRAMRGRVPGCVLKWIEGAQLSQAGIHELQIRTVRFERLLGIEQQTDFPDGRLEFEPVIIACGFSNVEASGGAAFDATQQTSGGADQAKPDGSAFRSKGLGKVGQHRKPRFTVELSLQGHSVSGGIISKTNQQIKLANQ